MENNMTTNKINDELREVYETYYKGLETKTDLLLGINSIISSPLFMKVFDEYNTMKYKILIVGQETNSWMEMDFNKHSVISLTNDYQNFSLGQNRHFKGWDDKDGKKPRDYLTSPFWNFSRSFFSSINGFADRRKKGFLWTNISKFDINYTTPDRQFHYPEGFELLRKEVQIVKPDIVLFLTGVNSEGKAQKPKYDEVIEKNLNLRFSPLEPNPLILKLNHGDFDFPENTFKIDHPRYLQSIKKNRNVMNDLLKQINFSYLQQTNSKP